MEKRINLPFYSISIILFLFICLIEVNGRPNKKPNELITKILSKFIIRNAWEYKNDSTIRTVKVSNNKDCMIRCYNTSGCMAFTWKPTKSSPYSYSCSLLSNITGGGQKNSKATSGYLKNFNATSNNKTKTVNATSRVIDQRVEATNMTSNNSQTNERSPLIQKLTWGRIIVEGVDQPFRDVKVFPGGAVAWDWRKTGTRHEPGTQPADLEELFTKNCETIILSSGIENRLQTTVETRNLLEQSGMVLNQDYFILQSERAVNLYNQLAMENKTVCAIIHSTC